MDVKDSERKEVDVVVCAQTETFESLLFGILPLSHSLERDVEPSVNLSAGDFPRAKTPLYLAYRSDYPRTNHRPVLPATTSRTRTIACSFPPTLPPHAVSTSPRRSRPCASARNPSRPRAPCTSPPPSRSLSTTRKTRCRRGRTPTPRTPSTPSLPRRRNAPSRARPTRRSRSRSSTASGGRSR